MDGKQAENASKQDGNEKKAIGVHSGTSTSKTLEKLHGDEIIVTRESDNKCNKIYLNFINKCYHRDYLKFGFIMAPDCEPLLLCCMFQDTFQ